MSRYSRQVMLPGVGEEGQRRLRGSHAAIVGCGALGCAGAEMLARAGVGRLTIIDRDVVEASNLQRQVLFDESDAGAGRAKAEAAVRRLATVNREVEARAVVAHLDHRNAMRLLDGAGIIVDGTDNFATRYLLNDVAVREGAPYVYAGVVGTSGMVMGVARGGACLRCVFEEPPMAGTQPTCETAGVLGPAVAVVAGLQAAAVIRWIVGGGTEAVLTEVDAWTGRSRRIEARRRAECVCCGARRFEFLEGRGQGESAVLCGRASVQVSAGEGVRVSLEELSRRLGLRVVEGVLARGVLTAERGEDGPITLTVFADGRAIVGGVRSVERARAMYDRYVGG
ncbi:MAG: ThiF family adenylyltransferase [Phycisphaerales bacterium]